MYVGLYGVYIGGGVLSVYSALLNVYRALWSGCNARFNVYMALLIVCRAVMSAYKALWGHYESI